MPRPAAAWTELPNRARHRHAANAFRERLAQLNITQSMNRAGKVADNAFMESFFHSMKSETNCGCTFTGDDQMLTVLRSYLPSYNRSRILSSLNYVSPATYVQHVGPITRYQLNRGKILPRRSVITKMLVDAGAKMNARDKAGRTP